MILAILLFSSIQIPAQAKIVQKTNKKTNLIDFQISQFIPIENGIFQNTITTFSKKDAEDLKEKFLDLEKKYTGSEKIKKQLNLLHENKLLSNEITLNLLLSFIEKMNNLTKPKLTNLVKLHKIFNGPMIVSHLTINGRIKCILPINKPKIYNHFINQSNIDGYTGFLPFFLGYSLKPVFVTAIGLNTPLLNNHLYFTLLELLIPCFGFSIAFIVNSEDDSPVVLFEYNLDACLLGKYKRLIF